MTLKKIALSLGLAVALVGSNAFALQLAAACEVDNNGMVTKTEFLKMMETKWDKTAKDAKELSVASTAMIFMDANRASN